MRNFLLSCAAAGVWLAVSSTGAFSATIPTTGLPTASQFSSNLLPDEDGIVSWRTLSGVEPVQQGDKIVPRFSNQVLDLDRKVVRVQGFILPLDLGDHQHHFLLSAVPPHCPFCLPAGPDAIVEVVAKGPVDYSIEPIIISGKFAVLKDAPAGLLYQLTDAELVAPPPLHDPLGELRALKTRIIHYATRIASWFD